MDLAIIGPNSIGIELYATLKDEISEVYLLGQTHEYGMAIRGHRIKLEGNDLNNIISIVNRHIKGECLLYITTDSYYDLLYTEYEQTKTWFNENIKHFGINHAFYSKMRDKKKYEKFLGLYGLSTPEIYAMEGSEEVELPVIVKYNGFRNENRQYKSKVVMSKEELEFETAQNYSKDYIFQKYYSPEEYTQYSYGCFVDQGEVKADIYVRQVGQYPRGVSMLVVEETDWPEDFISSVKALLKNEGYNGFIEFETLKKGGEIIVIDLNTRPWGWFYILNLKYHNFKKLISLKSTIPVEINRTHRVWVNYSRLSQGLIFERSFSVLRHVRMNRCFVNSLFFVYLTVKQKAVSAFK